MLAKKHRLNLSLTIDKQGFDFHSSKRFLTNNLIVYYQKNESLMFRVAVVAPSRLFPKATRRNYCRRLIYNLIRKKADELNETANINLFEENIDLMIVYKKKDFSLEELKEDLNTIFLKILH